MTRRHCRWVQGFALGAAAGRCHTGLVPPCGPTLTLHTSKCNGAHRPCPCPAASFQTPPPTRRSSPHLPLDAPPLPRWTSASTASVRVVGFPTPTHRVLPCVRMQYATAPTHGAAHAHACTCKLRATRCMRPTRPQYATSAEHLTFSPASVSPSRRRPRRGAVPAAAAGAAVPGAAQAVAARGARADGAAGGADGGQQAAASQEGQGRRRGQGQGEGPGGVSLGASLLCTPHRPGWVQGGLGPFARGAPK